MTYGSFHTLFRAVVTCIPILGLANITHAQDRGCEGLLFSTEEEFTMRDGEPFDGNPIISDGDLLAFNGGTASICRRNQELFKNFDVGRIDFGLDAIAAIDKERELLVFSTELDDPNGQFRSGDLVFTTGTVIPNKALTLRFQLEHDIGLDAVSLIGEETRWREFVEKISSVSRKDMVANPAILIELLDAFELDILFSTEGTAPDPRKPRFIDGDMLSVVTGSIFRHNATLLPALPAGIPANGVDFGLDAYTLGQDPRTGGQRELLSTEIISRVDGIVSDGDVLTPGPTIAIRNEVLLKTLLPATFDLGLDALHTTATDRIACAAPSITRVSNVDVVNINPQGVATVGTLNTRPFGGFIRIEGALPSAANCPDVANLEFRVEVDDGTGFPAITDPNTLIVPNSWTQQLDGNPSPSIIDCTASAFNPRVPYQPDPDGWFRVSDYWAMGECNDTSLAFWNSNILAGTVEAGDPFVNVRFRVVMRELGAGVAQNVTAPKTIRLDNNRIALPATKSTPLTGDVSLTYTVASGSDAKVEVCDVSGGSTDVILDLVGRARDQHFWRYTLRWAGGDAVGWKTISPTDRDGSGTPQPLDAVFDNDGLDRVDLTLGGTVPANDTSVLMSEFNLTQAHIAATGGTPPIQCGYTVEVTAWDRTLVGSFNGGNNTFGTNTRRTAYPVSFCYQPES